MNLLASNNENVDVRFIYAHNFLSEIMIQNSGVLQAYELKRLQKRLNKYVGFSEPYSKYAFDYRNNSGFFIYEMSAFEYKNKSVGDSIVLVDNILSFGYRIDVKNKNSNTSNQILYLQKEKTTHIKIT